MAGLASACTTTAPPAPSATAARDTGAARGASVAPPLLPAAPAAPTTPAASAPASPQGTATARGPRARTMVTASILEPAGLDPQFEPSLARQRLTPLLYNCLLRLAPDLSLQPDLAEAWDIAPDGLSLTFRLRPGVKWHNGRELVADDVKFSYERLAREESPAWRDFEAITAIEAPEKLQVVFRLREPQAGLLTSMANAQWAAIVNRETVDKHGNLHEIAVGTGPFALEEWAPGREIRLRSNRAYFRPRRPLLDQLTLRFFADEKAVADALRAGTVDHALLEDNRGLALLKEGSDLVFYRLPRLGYYFLMANHALSPFNDVRVMQALSWAVDRQEVLRLAAPGLGVVTPPAPPSLGRWQVERSLWEPFYRPDLSRARQLLAAAGLPNGFRTKLVSIPDFPVLAACAQAVQASLRRVGVEVEIQSVDYAAWVKRWLTKDFALTVNFTGGAADPDGAFYWPFHSEGANWNNWKEPEVDRLLAEGRATYDYGQRKIIYDQVQLLLLDRVAQLWLFCPDMIDVTQKWVRGWLQHPTTLFYSHEDVSVEG